MDNKSYLEGEMNAIKACAQVIQEALAAIEGQSSLDKDFVLIEFMGIMIRTNMIIKGTNEKLGIRK